jgi:protein-tyrosine phosphatase
MGGVSRSSSVVIAFLMKRNQMSLKDAIEYVKERRPIVEPNRGFMRQLIEYERMLFGETSIESDHPVSNEREYVKLDD